MGKPLVAIIGRPNVGKSTLFNRIVRAREAIVEDVPGVTRDRIYREASWDDREFIVVDTGGIYPEPEDDITRQTREQSLFAVEEADVIVLLFDAKEGVTELDREVVELIRPYNKPVIFGVNKIDSPRGLELLYDFYSLGIEELMPLSAATGYGFDDFMDRLISLFPEQAEQKPEEESLPRIAIVGKPNVGKSTLVNALSGRERMIVSDRPGTTRDAVDTVCKYYGRKYILVDTAGLRRKARVSYSLERYMVVRAIRSIDRADVVVLLIDALEGITEQDQKIASLIDRYGKGIILAFNKWDLVEEPDRRLQELKRQLQWKLSFISYAPVITLSGLNRKRTTKLFPLVDEIIAERNKRIPTAELNRFKDSLSENLPTHRGKRVKVFYATQTDTAPPAFVFFVNYPEAFKREYIRYMEKRLREVFGFKGTPVRIYIRERKR
ncbi:MAG: ribosome biogenesis GTPase Der [Nitrospirae bacterium]|nr:MAG: ribosome biogenesis GTPase Der [Nitrospirota bacterium]